MYGSLTSGPQAAAAWHGLGLIAAREEPSLKPRWEDINRRYAGASMDVRAEEVWALHCESIAPGQHAGQAQVLERGQQSFMETCIARVRPMQADDLHNHATQTVALIAHDALKAEIAALRAEIATLKAAPAPTKTPRKGTSTGGTPPADAAG